MDFKDFINWAFLSMISGSIIYAVTRLDKTRDQFMEEMSGMRKSMEGMNLKLATLLEKSLWFDRVLSEHNKRLIAVERAKGEHNE